MVTKNWYESKTLWLNIITFFVAALTVFTTTNAIDPKIVEVIGGVVALLNIVLRLWFTTTAIK